MTKTQSEIEERIIEKLADIEHQQWVEWAITIMKQEPISEARRERWIKYLCAYNELSEDVKEHDRKWARRVYKVVQEAIREAREEGAKAGFQEGRERALSMVIHELDIAEQDKEMADDPHDPKIRVKYLKNKVLRFIE